MESELNRARLKILPGYAPGAIQRFMSAAPRCDVHIVAQEE